MRAWFIQCSKDKAMEISQILEKLMPSMEKGPFGVIFTTVQKLAPAQSWFVNAQSQYLEEIMAFATKDFKQLSMEVKVDSN
jgi:hypothetical protein